MKAEHFERGRFHVHSHGQVLTVDTLSNKGAGRCDCMHWTTRIQKAIEEAKSEKRFDPSSPAFKCPHIDAADRALLMMFKQSLRKQFPDNEIET